MTARGRLWGGVATLLLSVGLALSAGTAASAALGAPYVAPIWVEYCGGCVGLVSADGAPTPIPFGVIVANSAAAAVKVTVDTSGIDASKVQVVGVTGPCTLGGVIVCDFGNLEPGNHTADLILKHRDGAAQGVSAGHVTITTSSSSDSTRTATGAVSVAFGSATNMTFSASASAASIGGTSTVTVAVHNHGPSTQPWVSAGFRPIPGTTFLGGTGCSLLPEGVSCRVENLLPGGNATATAQLRVDSCAATQTASSNGWAAAIEDVNPYDNGFTFTISVAGCSASTGGGSSGHGSTGGGSGGSAGSGSVDQAAAVASAEPSATASPSPEQTSSISPVSTSVNAEAGRPAATSGHLPLLWIAGAAALLAAAAGGALWWRRRHRPTDHPEGEPQA